MRYLKYLIIILFSLLIFIPASYAEYSLTNQLDLNNCSFQAIKQLPISEELAHKIYEYREFKDHYKTIYDLLQVKGMTQEKFEELAAAAKAGCPISRLVAAADIKLSATLNASEIKAI